MNFGSFFGSKSERISSQIEKHLLDAVHITKHFDVLDFLIVLLGEHNNFYFPGQSFLLKDLFDLMNRVRRRKLRFTGFKIFAFNLSLVDKVLHSALHGAYCVYDGLMVFCCHDAASHLDRVVEQVHKLSDLVDAGQHLRRDNLGDHFVPGNLLLLHQYVMEGRGVVKLD